MNLWTSVYWLLRKELLLEWRSSYAISGILLYVFSTIFIVYSAFINLDPQVWHVTFWIIMLFASVNAITKSFQEESGARQLYYYTLTHPIAVILAKIIYNVLLLLLLSLLIWFGLGVVGGNPVRRTGQFITAIFLASAGFSITFTFISAIASKASNNATLIAILSFPLVIPILMTLIKLSASALGLLTDTSTDSDVLILVGIDLVLLAVALVLYPFLWRD